MTKNLTNLESEIMKWLLSGDDPVIEAVRNQFSEARIISREATTAGTDLEFEVPPDIPKLHEILPVKQRFIIRDLIITSDRVKSGANFILWIIDGTLHSLEGYTYADEWPIDSVDSSEYEFSYMRGEKRDWAWLRKEWEIK